MTVEEQLKAEILKQYKSVRAFTTEIGIPYTTLDSVFKRGIAKAGIGTMIKVFDALNLDIESIPSGVLKTKKTPEPESPVSEAEIDRVAGILYNAFLDAGLIEEGQDLTPEQIDFLDGLISIIHAFFNKGQ